MKGAKLTEKEIIFCREYIYDWNATRAYQKAYPKSSYDTAKVNGCKALTKTNIQEEVKRVQEDLEKNAGISRQKVLEEYIKIAFSSIAHLHNTWIERKEFEELTESQKACISEISTRIKKIGKDLIDVEEVKIKLYDKQRALESINKMLGYNEPDKLDHTNDGEPFDIEVFIVNGKNKTKKKN